MNMMIDSTPETTSSESELEDNLVPLQHNKNKSLLVKNINLYQILILLFILKQQKIPVFETRISISILCMKLRNAWL
jgi:hypothetical protein